MKEKLEVIREKLELMQHPYANDGANKQLLEQATTLLDSLIAELDAEDDNKLESEVPLYNSGKW